MSQSKKAKLIHQKVASLAKLLQCAICLEILENPIITKCSHHLCKQCWLTYVQRKYSVACPICKARITKRGTNQNDQIDAIVAAARNLVEAYKLDMGIEVTPKKEHSFLQAPSLGTVGKKNGSLAHTLPDATSKEGNLRSQMVNVKQSRGPSKLKRSRHKCIIRVEDSNTEGIAIEETVQAEANQQVFEKGVISPETDSDFDYHIQNKKKDVHTSTSIARETCPQNETTQMGLDHVNNRDVVMLASPNSANTSEDSKLPWSSWIVNHSGRRKMTKINSVKTYSKKDMIRQTKDKEDSMSSKGKVENWFRHSKDHVITSLPRSPDKQGVKNTLKQSNTPIKLKNHTLASPSRSHGLVNQENSTSSKRKDVVKTPNKKRALNDIKNSPNIKRRREFEDSDDTYTFIPSQQSKKPAKKARSKTKGIRKRGAGITIKNLMQEISMPLTFSSRCTSESTKSLKANSICGESMISLSKSTPQQESSVDADKPQSRNMRTRDLYDKNGKALFSKFPSSYIKAGEFTVSKAPQNDNSGVYDSGAADFNCTPVFKVGLKNPDTFTVTKLREASQCAKQNCENGGDKVSEFPERRNVIDTNDQVDDDDVELFVTPLFMVSKPTAPSKPIRRKTRKEKRETEHLKENQDKIEVFKEELAAADCYDLEVEVRGSVSKSKKEETAAFFHNWETDRVHEEHEVSSSFFNTTKETYRHGDFNSFSVSVESSNQELINIPQSDNSDVSEVASSKTKRIKGNLQNTDLSGTQKEGIRMDKPTEHGKEYLSEHLGTKEIATNTPEDAFEDNHGIKFHNCNQTGPAQMQSNAENAATKLELNTEMADENCRPDTKAGSQAMTTDSLPLSSQWDDASDHYPLLHYKHTTHSQSFQDFSFTSKKASSSRKPDGEGGLLEIGEQEEICEFNVLEDHPANAAKYREEYCDENSSNPGALEEKNSRNKGEICLMETENQKSNFPSAVEFNDYRESCSDKLQISSEDNMRLSVSDLVEPITRGKEIQKNRNCAFSKEAVLETTSKLTQNTGMSFIQSSRKTFDLTAETQDLKALNLSNNQNTLDMLNDLGLVSQPCQEAEEEESQDANVEMCTTLDTDTWPSHKPKTICVPATETECGSRELSRVHRVSQTEAETKSDSGHMENMQTCICPSCNCRMSIKIICICSEGFNVSEPVPNNSKEVLKVDKATNTAIKRAEQPVILKCDKVTNTEFSKHSSVDEGTYTEAVHSIVEGTNTKAVHSINEGTNTKAVHSINEGTNTKAVHSINEGTNTEAVHTNSRGAQTEHCLTVRGTDVLLDRDHTKGMTKAEKSTMTDLASESVKQPISVHGTGYLPMIKRGTNMEVSTPMVCLDVLHAATKAITIPPHPDDPSPVSTQGYDEYENLESTQPYVPATERMRTEVFDNVNPTDTQTSENMFSASHREKADSGAMVDETDLLQNIQIYSGCAISSPVARDVSAEACEATTQKDDFTDAELSRPTPTEECSITFLQNDSIPMHNIKAESTGVSASCNRGIISSQSNEFLSTLKTPAAIPMDKGTVLYFGPVTCLETDNGPDQDTCSNIFQSQKSTDTACDEVVNCTVISEDGNDDSTMSEKGNEANSEYVMGLVQTDNTDAGSFQNDGCKYTLDAMIPNESYIEITQMQHKNQKVSGAPTPDTDELTKDQHNSEDQDNHHQGQQYGTWGGKNTSSGCNLFTADLSKEYVQEDTKEVEIIGMQDNEQNHVLSLDTLQTGKLTDNAEMKSESQEAEENSPKELFLCKRHRSSCIALQHSDSTEEAPDEPLIKNLGKSSNNAAGIPNHTFNFVSPSNPDLLFAQSLVTPLESLTPKPQNPCNLPDKSNEALPVLANCVPQWEGAPSSFGHMAFCANGNDHHVKPLVDSDDKNSTGEFFDPFLPKERDRIQKSRQSLLESKTDLNGVAGTAHSPVDEELQKAALAKGLGLFSDSDDESDDKNVSRGSLLTDVQNISTESTDGDCRETQMRKEIAEMKAKIRAMEQQLRNSTRNTAVKDIPCMVHQEPQSTETAVSNEEYDSSDDGFNMAIAPTPPSSLRPLGQVCPTDAVHSKSSDFSRMFR